MNIKRWTPCLVVLCTAGWSACSADAPAPNSGAATRESAPTSTASRLPDPCELLTFAEIGSALGPLPRDTVHSDVGPYQKQCVWSAPENPHPILVLGITTGASTSWEEYVQGMIEDDYGDPRESGERVDVGLFGYFDGSMLQVHADGGLLLTLVANRGFAAREAAVQVGRAAVARLP